MNQLFIQALMGVCTSLAVALIVWLFKLNNVLGKIQEAIENTNKLMSLQFKQGEERFERLEDDLEKVKDDATNMKIEISKLKSHESKI